MPLSFPEGSHREKNWDHFLFLHMYGLTEKQLTLSRLHLQYREESKYKSLFYFFFDKSQVECISLTLLEVLFKFLINRIFHWFRYTIIVFYSVLYDNIKFISYSITKSRQSMSKLEFHFIICTRDIILCLIRSISPQQIFLFSNLTFNSKINTRLFFNVVSSTRGA